jgi:hypothetical protein
MKLLPILISPSYGNVYVYKWRGCRGGHGPGARANRCNYSTTQRNGVFDFRDILTEKKISANLRSRLHFETLKCTQR